MDQSLIVVAEVGRPFGIAGWVYIHSCTEPGTQLFEYGPLRFQGPKGNEWCALEIETWRSQQTGIVAKFKGCDDRTAAQRLTGGSIAVLRTQLPALDETHFYWGDLEGLSVQTTQGETVGTVAYLYNMGASDVMVVLNEGQEIHLPFVMNEVVRAVSLDERTIIVEWDLTDNQA